MIERSMRTPDARAMEATLAGGPGRFGGFFAAGAGAPVGFEGCSAAEPARLFGALCFVTGDRHEAEEIMQDAFLRLWERWDDGRIDDPPAYLSRTAADAFGHAP